MEKNIYGEGMSKLEIRQMEEADIKQTVKMISYYNKEHSLCALRDFKEFFLNNGVNRKANFLIALINYEIVGCMGYHSDSDQDAEDVYWTTYLYIHPNYYRQGIASKLSLEIEKRIQNIGGRKIYLDIGNAEDQPEAILFHTKHGYKKEGELIDYFRDGENKLLFGKKIK